MATKKRKPYVKLQCKSCKSLNYMTNKSKTLQSEGIKIGLSKFCNSCRKHVQHTETKK